MDRMQDIHTPDWADAVTAINRGLDANLHDVWRFLDGERHGLELVIRRAGLGAPSHGMCRCKVRTFDALVERTRQQQQWMPDVSYVRMNPSKKVIPGIWHAIAEGAGTGDRDISEIKVLYLDGDAPKHVVEAEPQYAQLTWEMIRHAHSILADILGVRVHTATAQGFSGRGSYGWTKFVGLPNDLECATLIQETYAGLVACVQGDLVLDDTATNASRVGPLAGVFKRKAKSGVKFYRTGIIIPERLEALSYDDLRRAHKDVGRGCRVFYAFGKPTAELDTFPSFIAVANEYDCVYEMLGFDPACPDCPICAHLQLADDTGGFAGDGVKFLEPTVLFCQHYSCRDARGGQHGQRPYDWVCWTIVGKEKGLSVEERDTVKAWFERHTDIAQRLYHMQLAVAANQKGPDTYLAQLIEAAGKTTLTDTEISL